jgi:DUF4097 and DUF4098 domain-containing protein YvlB
MMCQQQQAVSAGRGTSRLPVEERGLGAAVVVSVVLTLLLVLSGIASGRPVEARREVRTAISRGACTVVRIEGSSGSVTVHGGRGDSVLVRAVLIVRGSDEAKARELLAGVDLGVRPHGQKILVRLEKRDGGPRPRRNLELLNELLRGECLGVQAEFNLDVPAAMAVSVDLTNGKVGIAGVRGKVAVDATSGEIEVADGGEVALDVTSGTARLRDLTGAVVFDGTSGHLDMARCVGALRVDVTSGGIAVRDLRGDVTIDGMSCDALLTGVTGDVRFSAVGGRLVLSDFLGSLDMDTTSGGLDLSGAVPERGHVRVETASGDLRLALAKLRDASLRLRSERGRIDAGALAQRVRSDGQRQLVTVIGKTPGVEIQLHSTSGDITLAERERN